MTRSTHTLRAQQLRVLIKQHGVDVVARTTELSPRTLLEYAGRSARTIPLGKLVAAQQKLKATHFEQKRSQ